MQNTFSSCNHLTALPAFSTSNVTSMSYMCSYCYALTTIPQFDTSGVTNMSGMLYGCIGIRTIPVLNTSNVTTMYNMFYGCDALTSESLNNILQMCINATSYTNTKTLKALGLTSTQATTCTGLSNYSAFIAAGWTTGY